MGTSCTGLRPGFGRGGRTQFLLSRGSMHVASPILILIPTLALLLIMASTFRLVLVFAVLFEVFFEVLFAVLFVLIFGVTTSIFLVYCLFAPPIARQFYLLFSISLADKSVYFVLYCIVLYCSKFHPPRCNQLP